MRTRLAYPLKTLVYLLGAGVTLHLRAHETPMHRRMTTIAAEASFSMMNSLYDSFGEPDSGDPLNSLKFHCPDAIPGAFLTLLQWIATGAHDEDDGFRPTAHFYTPLRPVKYITDASEFAPTWLAKPGQDSLTWASYLDCQGPHMFFTPKVIVGPNLESWQNAREYLNQAIAGNSPEIREEGWAHVFYALGHVLHLNQDLSQPDHVRNDNHIEKAHRWIENYGNRKYIHQIHNTFGKFPDSWAADSFDDDYRNTWSYAGFSRLSDFWDRSLYGGSATALNNDSTAKSYAYSKLLGLAEFVNGNFMGEDSGYKEYFSPGDQHYFPYPALTTGTTFPQVRRNLAAGVGTVFLKDGTTSVSRTYIAKIADGVIVPHHSVLTHLGTVFPQKGGPVAKVATTINDDNVLQELHEAVIPRAIEYSRGILDYFFRADCGIDSAFWNTEDNKIHLMIMGPSAQQLRGGAFHVYFDDAASGTRLDVLSLTSKYSGTLGISERVELSFSVPNGAVKSFTVTFENGTCDLPGVPSDPIDVGRVTWGASFSLVWFRLHLNNPLETVRGEIGSAVSDDAFDFTEGGLIMDDYVYPFAGRDYTLSLDAPREDSISNYTVSGSIDIFFNSAAPIKSVPFSFNTYHPSSETQVLWSLPHPVILNGSRQLISY